MAFSRTTRLVTVAGIVLMVAAGVAVMNRPSAGSGTGPAAPVGKPAPGPGRTGNAGSGFARTDESPENGRERISGLLANTLAALRANHDPGQAVMRLRQLRAEIA